jgi:hypothetical protein
LYSFHFTHFNLLISFYSFHFTHSIGECNHFSHCRNGWVIVPMHCRRFSSLYQLIVGIAVIGFGHFTHCIVLISCYSLYCTHFILLISFYSFHFTHFILLILLESAIIPLIGGHCSHFKALVNSQMPASVSYSENIRGCSGC